MLGSAARTAAGLALLRTSLLQPLTNLAALQAQGDAVAELGRKSDAADALGAALAAFPIDVHASVGGVVAARAGGGGIGRVEALARSLASVRAALACVPGLATALGACASSLLAQAAADLAHPVYAQLAAEVDWLVVWG